MRLKHVLFLMLVLASAKGYAGGCCWKPPSEWFCPLELEADASVGYGIRHDMIQTLVYSYNDAHRFIGSDEIKTKNMGLSQTSGKIRVDLCSFFFRIDGAYASGNRGRFRDTFSSTKDSSRSSGNPSWNKWGSDDSAGEDAWTHVGSSHRSSSSNSWMYSSSSSSDGIHRPHLKSKIHDVHAKDFNVGLGYLFCLSPCFEMGPLGGYSYHGQSFETTRAYIDGTAVPLLNNLKYKTRWQGPWAGLDMIFHSSCFHLNVGYEFHFGHWNADFISHDLAFSDHRNSHHSHGNVLYIDGRFDIWCNWTLGFGLTFQNWRASKGEETIHSRTFTKAGIPRSSHDEVKHAQWRSSALIIDLGYNFFL